MTASVRFAGCVHAKVSTRSENTKIIHRCDGCGARMDLVEVGAELRFVPHNATKRWAVWIPKKKCAASPVNPERIWSTTNRVAAEARAEFVAGEVVELAWLLANLEKLRTGEVTL